MIYRLAAIAAIIAALGGALWWLGDSRYDAGYETAENRYKAAISNQKIEAAGKLKTETDKVAALQYRLSDLLAEQNTKDAENVKTINTQGAELRRLRNADGRLRDPAAGRGDGCSSASGQTGSTPDAGSANSGQTGGLLSAELSGLLLRLTSEADEVNAAYASCRADAVNLRAAWPK